MRKFAPHQEEREMALRYISGLSYHIQIYMRGLCCETIDKAITAAMSMEAKRELFKIEQ